MQLDPNTIFAAIVPVLLALLYGELRLRFFTGKMDHWMKDLKEWAPRMVASLRWNKAEETTQQAREQGGIVGTLATLGELAPLLESIPQLLSLAEQFGLLKPQQGSGGGGTW